MVDVEVDDVDVDDDEHAPTATTQPAIAASLLTEGACRREAEARKARRI